MEVTFFSTFGSCKNGPRKGNYTKPSGGRPVFEFRFSDKWAFDRRVTPALRIAPDFCGVEFDVDLQSLANLAGQPLGRLETDLIWLAVAVYLADRCSPRYPYGMSGPEYWRRNIRVKIPVSDVTIWEKSEAALAYVLEYLTEDDWTFEFIPGRAEFGAERQRHFSRMRAPNIAWASLFSGGLDSLAGALQWLTRTDGVGLLVSGQTHSRIAVGQESQVAELRAHFPRRIEHVGIRYGFPDKQRDSLEGFESTQRTRAFMHTALGSVAAHAKGRAELYLFENGIGALNLPCDSAQSGSQSSRGTHPVFLRRMAEFVSSVFSQSFVIANPFTLHTKAQMLTTAGVRRLSPLLEKSFSCDRYPNYNHAVSQCGYCPSCLIRRMSLYVAGLADNAANYSTNVLKPNRQLREAELLPLLKLTVQANSLETCLRAERPWSALCRNWPDLLRSQIELSSPGISDAVIDLVRRHVEEWRSFSCAIRSGPLALAA